MPFAVIVLKMHLPLTIRELAYFRAFAWQHQSAKKGQYGNFVCNFDEVAGRHTTELGWSDFKESLFACVDIDQSLSYSPASVSSQHYQRMRVSLFSMMCCPC